MKFDFLFLFGFGGLGSGLTRDANRFPSSSPKLCAALQRKFGSVDATSSSRGREDGDEGVAATKMLGMQRRDVFAYFASAMMPYESEEWQVCSASRIAPKRCQVRCGYHSDITY